MFWWNTLKVSEVGSNMSEKILESELFSILENPQGELEEFDTVRKSFTYKGLQDNSQSQVRGIPTKDGESLSPVVEIDTDKVEVFGNAPDFERTDEKAKDFLKSWRQQRYQKKIEEFGNSIKIVSEGDSWFQFPIFLDDIIDQIFEPKKPFTGENPYAIYSLGTAADRLDLMVEKEEFIQPIRNIQPAYFLISGGGNDLRGKGGKGIEEVIFKLSDNDKPLKPQRPKSKNRNDDISNGEYYARRYIDYAKEYIDEKKLAVKLESVMSSYKKLFDKVFGEPAFSEGIILCHGYDYVRPIKGGRALGEKLGEKNITDEEVMGDILANVINRFNEELVKVIDKHDHKDRIVHVDCRGAAGRNDWHKDVLIGKIARDDFHPNNAGFEKIAERFIQKLEELEGNKD